MAFDPYHRWLGIPPRHQPPNHYRLLGIELFEEDPGVIETAADQRMMLLRTFQAGQHADDSQRLLNEVSAAKVCLLNATAKAAYDGELEARPRLDPVRESPSPVAVAPFPPPAPLPSPAIERAAPALLTPRRLQGRRPAWQQPAVLTAAGCGLLAMLGIVALLAGNSGERPVTRRPTGAPGAPAAPARNVPPAVPPIAPPAPVPGNGDDSAAIPSVDWPETPDELPVVAPPPERVAVASNPPLPPPVGDWPGLDPAATLVVYSFEESTLVRADGQLRVKDLSGRGCDGVVSGARAVEGRCSGGLYFDGRDDFVALPQLRSQILAHPEAITVLAWVRSQRTAEQYRTVAMMFDVGGYAHASLTLCVSSRQFQFWTPNRYGGRSLNCGPEIDTQWHHLAAVWDGAEMRLYLDSALQGQRATDRLALHRRSIEGYPARLGSQAKGLFQRGRFFQGVIDEFAVLSAVLSVEELRAVYEAGRHGRSLRVRTGVGGPQTR